MRNPVPLEKVEAIIYEYIRLKYLVLNCYINKMHFGLENKAKELRIGTATAWRIVKWGKEIGMIDNCYYFW